MIYPYLQDRVFLKTLDSEHLKEQYAKIILLDWQEKPIKEITGIVTGGSINVDGNSAIRRAGNLSIFIENDKDGNVLDVDNILSINKKISLEIGLKNTTNNYRDYPIIWFPQGIYVLTSASTTNSTSGITASIQIKDKMCLLNGECGGTLPAAVTFNEIETTDENGELITLYPTMYQIIVEAVNHWGGEQLGKIVISDLETTVKKVMKWTGSMPLYLYRENEMSDQEFTIDKNKVADLENRGIKYETFTNGQDVGYIYTDFCYPGDDLIIDAGGTVCDLLNKIKDVLGNYEFFYDINGNFIFQEVKNFLNTSKSTVELEKLNNSSYLVDQALGNSDYVFDDSTLIASYSNNPKYDMIKNDFVVWGEKKLPTGGTVPIRYHLAIDKKPEIGKEHIVFKYEDPVDGLIKAKATRNFYSQFWLPEEGDSGFYYYVQGPTDLRRDIFEENQLLFDEHEGPLFGEGPGTIYVWDNNEKEFKKAEQYHLDSLVAEDWRTELYLQGVDAEPFGTNSNYYYMELQSEWPKVYELFGNPGDFYKEFKDNPNEGEFYIDFIDTNTAIGELGVDNIGRRTKVVVDSNVNCLFPPKIPDLIILESGAKDAQEQRNECIYKGQNFTQVESRIYSRLAGGGGLYSAFELIKDLLYQHTSYNESITLQTIPLYHLEPNTTIQVEDPVSGISGNYVVTSFSIPFGIDGTMNISAVKALTKI